MTKEDAKAFYLESIQHQLISFSIFQTTENKSDHIIRSSIKVFGSSDAFRKCSGAFATPAELGYASKEEELVKLLGDCMSTLEELDPEYIYVEPEELTVYKELLAEMKVAYL